MTTHRRGGRPNGGTKRKRQAQQRRRRRSSSTTDEESSEGSSITRCICGETHNLGLMVQCDKCEVWQHCRCMGLEQPDIPDQYYCEQCKPDHHQLQKLANGRTKRHYSASGHATVQPSGGPAPKKRMTLNSREASMSLEDVLAARSALEMYESKNNSDMDDYEETNKLESLPETIDEKPEPPSSTVSSVGHEELPPTTSLVSSPDEQVPSSPIVKSTTNSKPAVKRNHKKETTVKRGHRGNLAKRRGNGRRSRTGTPQPSHDGSPLPQQQQLPPSDEESSTPHDLSTVLFDYFSPQARASSPPAKTRHPHARMSITEMNRRANQILEYISSIQVEMATNPSLIHAGHSTTPKEVVDDDDDDDNCSLSSASTIPLVEKEPPPEKQTSLEIMDMLTRKLIMFQKRFGSRNRALYEEAMMEGEGRITRSREASSGHSTNNNAYRNMMAH